MHDPLTLPTTQLTALANELEEVIKVVRKGGLPEALTFWKASKDEYEAFDEQRKRVYAALESLSRQTLPEMMAEHDTKTITLDSLGYRFTVSQRFSCSMPDPDAGMKWLKENGLGDLIKPTVNAQTLSSAVKKRIEDDGMEVPPELFNTSYAPFTSATKVK